MKLLMVATFLLALTGCSVLDSITGVDDPAREAQVLGTIESLDSALPAPWGWAAGAIGGAAVTTYVGVRRRQKAEAAV